MSDYTIIQEEDQSITLTASSAPEFGSSVIWVLIDRVTKADLFSKTIDHTGITGANILVDLADTDTADYHGAYYYELWQHGAGVDKLLDSGTVRITATYAGEVS